MKVTELIAELKKQAREIRCGFWGSNGCSFHANESADCVLQEQGNTCPYNEHATILLMDYDVMGIQGGELRGMERFVDVEGVHFWDNSMPKGESEKRTEPCLVVKFIGVQEALMERIKEKYRGQN